MTSEQIVGSLRVPEGTVVLRHVNLEGQADESWLAHYGESHYLLRKNCLYFLDPRESWDEVHRQLRPPFRDNLRLGRIAPNFCFPLEAGNDWGDSRTDFSWQVVGHGADVRLGPVRAAGRVWEIVSTRFSSGDTIHFWWEKGVGIVEERDIHNGTYIDLRVHMVHFEPAAAGNR
jgi:hypothetical protein